jgi:hypothetical protein
MDQLVNQIAQQTGIPQDKARQAVQMVVGFLKGKLPAPVGSQLDSALGGQGSTGMTGQMSQAPGALGGIFGQDQHPPRNPNQ